jgi:DNA repair protein SbcC/Rad50
MIPKHLKISGFLSYFEPVELDFTGFGLACITGSNGSGKSSLLDAITWSLFGQARRRDDALIHDLVDANSTVKAAEVTFDFYYEDSQYRVKRSKARGKTAQLEFYIMNSEGVWRGISEHSLRETETAIQNVLRLDYETFINASFFLQGKADYFTQKRPSERKKILSSILGLEIWEIYRERTVANRRQIEKELDVLDSRLEEINNELDQEDERNKRLSQLEADLEKMVELRKQKETNLQNARKLVATANEKRLMVAALEKQVVNARERLTQSEQRLVENRSSQERYLREAAAADEIEAEYQQWRDLRAALDNWDRIASDFKQHEIRRSEPIMEIESERARLIQEQSHLNEQQAETVEAAEKVALLDAQTEEISAKIAQIEESVTHPDEIRSLLDGVEARKAELTAENKQLYEQMHELRDRIDRLEATNGVACPYCGQSLNAEERQQLVEKFEDQGKQMADDFNTNKDELAECKQKVIELKAQVDDLQSIESQINQLQGELALIDERRKYSTQTIESWQREGIIRLEEINKVLKKDDFAHEARIRLGEIDSTLKELGYDAETHDSIRREEEPAQASQERYQALQNARAALEPLNKMIADQENEIEAAGLNLEELDNSYQQASQFYQQEAAELPDVAQEEADLFALHERENQVRMEVGGARQEVLVLETQRERKTKFENERQEITRQIGRVKALERAFGKDGVPALLIEQALPEIEAQANEYLGRLTGGRMFISFETLRAYKDNKREDRRETLDIIISDPAGKREYELFSGGEAFRVNFALRLALSRVLAQRAGARLQTLIIDEGFGSQDEEGRRRLLEAINHVRGDFEKILVITHLEDLKDAFPARIEVEKKDNRSSLQVVT